MANKKGVAETTDAAKAQAQVDSVPEATVETAPTTTEEAPKAPQNGVDAQVNPEMDTQKVSIATGEQDENGNNKFLHFLAGKTYTVEEAMLEAKDYDGTPFLVKTKQD